jgi:hypothetical protein
MASASAASAAAVQTERDVEYIISRRDLGHVTPRSVAMAIAIHWPWQIMNSDSVCASGKQQVIVLQRQTSDVA